METWIEKRGKGGSLEDGEHWEVRPILEEDYNEFLKNFEERIGLSLNEMSLNLKHDLTEYKYRREATQNITLKMSEVMLVILMAWIAVVLRGFRENEMCGVNCQEIYAD